MRLGHFLFGLFIIALLIAGVFVVFTALISAEYFEEIFGWVARERHLALGSVFAGLLLTLLYLLTSERETGPAEFISYDSSGGAVSISVAAVKDFVQKIGGEFAAVRAIHPAISVRSGGIIVSMDVRLAAGTQIPELSRMLQERVRESLRDHLGLVSVREVRVNVREIIGLAPSTAAAHEEIEKRING